MDSSLGNATEYFYQLTPSIIDLAVKQLGFEATGRVLALNSLENRVYEVEVEDFEAPEGPFSSQFIIVKFYRPGRWSEDALFEEHAFLHELIDEEIPVIAPLVFDGETLFMEESTGLIFSVYPKVRGRLKDEFNPTELFQLGQILARLHNTAELMDFEHRPVLHPKHYIQAHEKMLKSADFLPKQMRDNYLLLCKTITPAITQVIERQETQRVHGDVHKGNILWTDDGPWLLDFDDCATGPREQDLWLLLPGTDLYSRQDREKLLESYEMMSNHRPELSDLLVECLRTMRMIHFNGWICKRYLDPAFERAYPSFTSESYWEGQVQDMKEQIAQIQELFY